MTARNLAMAAALMVGLGLSVLVFFVPSARAAEDVARDPATHQLVVCKPDQGCERRLKPSGETACLLNAASDRLLADLPSGTWIVCMPLVRR